MQEEVEEEEEKEEEKEEEEEEEEGRGRNQKNEINQLTWDDGSALPAPAAAEGDARPPPGEAGEAREAAAPLTADEAAAAVGERRRTWTMMGSWADWKTLMASSCDDLDTSTPFTCSKDTQPELSQSH